MASTIEFAPEVWAIILAAFLGAIVGQFLSFYRSQRQEIEELKATLYLIAQLDVEDIDSKIDRPDSILWYLREELYEGFKSNILYLRDPYEDVLDVVRLFPSEQMDSPTEYTSPSKLKQAARQAFESLDQIKWYQLFWQSILGFFGFSQTQYSDVLEEYLETNEVTLEDVDEFTLDDKEIDGVEPATQGIWIPSPRFGILETVSVVIVIGAAGIVYVISQVWSVSTNIQIGLLAGASGLAVGVLLSIKVHRIFGRRVDNSDSNSDSNSAERESGSD